MKAENPEKTRKSFISAYKINIFMPVDIVEVVDSSSTTPTILHQAKPLESSKIPAVFLFYGPSRYNPLQPAKTGSTKQDLPKIYQIL